MSMGLKTPPLEQRKKRGFCKYHNSLDHKTSRCVLFRDFVQIALKEGRLKFGDKQKPQMTIDSNAMLVQEENKVEPVEIMMVKATKGLDAYIKGVKMSNYIEKMKVV